MKHCQYEDSFQKINLPMSVRKTCIVREFIVSADTDKVTFLCTYFDSISS